MDFLNRNRHHFELERAAVRALANGDARSAYRLADRRCRISPLPNSQVYLLRAEALHLLGHSAAALDDVGKAIEINPDDVAATRRLMSWGDSNQRIQAASAVVAHDSDWNAIRTAIDLLCQNGPTAFARTDVLDNEISGWVAWPPGDGIEIRLSSVTDAYSIALAPDRDHPLAQQNALAANFYLRRQSSVEQHVLSITQGEVVVATTTIKANRPAPASSKNMDTAAQKESEAQPALTVIVPVFADYRATKACLDSLLSAAALTENLRVLIVDDASPDARILTYLASLAERPGVTLLINDRNLGFVGAVNRGLTATPSGDVILLNADTLVPSGALTRLRQAVVETPGVGTATPLSNNGEFTSFPVKNTSNSLPQLGRVEVVDRLAGAVNAGRVVDIPNGIGFCLYVTRACLDAVGELSDDFHRGYLEDVDFCLRAAEAGFRNICVPSVFVGHEGSRSFRQEKRSLVVRNLKVLEQRYPRYQTECAAFLVADPLQESRGRLERALLAQDARPVQQLIVCNAGAVADIAMARARELTASGRLSLLTELAPDGPHLWIGIRNANLEAPQSLRFDFAMPDGIEQFQQYLAETAPGAIELCGIDRIPPRLIELLTARSCPYDILLTGTELADLSGPAWRVAPQWRPLLGGARAIIGADADADAFGRAIGLEMVGTRKPARRQARRGAGTAATQIGVVVPEGSTDEFFFLRELALQITAREADLDLIAIGATMDDLALMQIPHVHVTGVAAAADIDRMLAAYAIDRLVIGPGRTLFGHPICTAAVAAGVPSVRFGSRPSRAGGPDLWIAPGTPHAAAAAEIVSWLAG